MPFLIISDENENENSVILAVIFRDFICLADLTRNENKNEEKPTSMYSKLETYTLI